jgi:hypothetical protein
MRPKSDPYQVAIVTFAFFAIGYFTYLLLVEDDPLDTLMKARSPAGLCPEDFQAPEPLRSVQ